MNSSNSSRLHPATSESFSLCDNIATFYEKLDVPTNKTTGILGGKSYTWNVTNEGQPFQIRCGCNAASLGFGVLLIESRIAGGASTPRLFRKSSVVNPSTAKINMESAFGFSEHQIRLPIPDKKSDSFKK